MDTPFKKRVRLTIIICQVTTLLACVIMMFLMTTVFIPSFRTLNSGFSENTVMCTTVSSRTVPDCEESGVPTWSSCSEGCYSTSTETCPQIRVDVRRNGSNLRLEECNPEVFDTKYYHGIEPKVKGYECIHGDCSALHGIFNCNESPGETEGAVCQNVTSVLSCKLSTLDLPIMCNTKKACLNLDGLYECTYGNCERVQQPFECEKRLIPIKTENKDIIIRQGDVIYTAQCSRVRDMETELEIWPKNLKSLSEPERPPMLIMFCTNVIEDPQDPMTYTLSDCFNGTLLEPNHFGNFANLSYVLQSHYESSKRLLDVERQFVPPESDLLIYNATPFFINHDGCVNTFIKNECEKFEVEYGVDGSDDLRTQSRFQCYYSQDNSDFVVLRFSRNKTLMELIVAIAVPTTVAIVSCFTWVLCTRIRQVGDDWQFYWPCCKGDAEDATLEENEDVELEAMVLK